LGFFTYKNWGSLSKEDNKIYYYDIREDEKKLGKEEIK
jgi:hypothetical protein